MSFQVQHSLTHLCLWVSDDVPFVQHNPQPMDPMQGTLILKSKQDIAFEKISQLSLRGLLA